MIAIDLPKARRLAFSVVLWQAAVALGVALVCWAVADFRAAVSALLGGGIAASGSLLMAVLVFGGGKATDAQRVLGTFYLGEALKVALMMVLFVVVLKWMNVVPLAMFAAFAATFLVYWIALLSALPAAGRMRPGA
ncbi:MAG TPA: ATP synthase subunit I [Steroidobacteraceae bacterium]|nr:ATP synthase subunit I [Steroidobacteraceae bacterium]